MGILQILQHSLEFMDSMRAEGEANPFVIQDKMSASMTPVDLAVLFSTEMSLVNEFTHGTKLLSP